MVHFGHFGQLPTTLKQHHHIPTFVSSCPRTANVDDDDGRDDDEDEDDEMIDSREGFSNLSREQGQTNYSIKN